MTQISVTRALTEIKHLSDRIARDTNKPFVGVAKGHANYKTCQSAPSMKVEAFSDAVKANLNSVLDLIAYREKLKRAVIKSNAETIVVIAGESMTVAEAIEKKANIAFTERLIATLRHQLVTANGVVEKANKALSDEINNAVISAYGNEKGKVDEAQYEAVALPRQTRNALSLIDPNNVEQVIETLSDKMSKFLEEVDFSLSESNSITKIEV